MKKIESTQELEKAVKDDWAVFMFSADWCPDCRFVEPLLPELEANFPEFTYYYVDRDKFIDTCAEWEIYGIPSFVVFNEGKEVNSFCEQRPQNKEEIEQFLTDSLAKCVKEDIGLKMTSRKLSDIRNSCLQHENRSFLFDREKTPFVLRIKRPKRELRSTCRRLLQNGN